MNVPVWLLIIAPPVIATFGFLTCAFFTAGTMSDLRGNAYDDRQLYRDARAKLSAIRDLLDTPRTIRKGALAAILDGDA